MNTRIRRYLNIIQQKFHTYQRLISFQQCQNTLKNCIKDKITDRAIGSVYGAMIGDALGAYCQFQQHLQQKTVDLAMKMPGGGTFGLRPGQFTDDSQMAVSLLLGLLNIDLQKKLQLQYDTLICQIGIKYIQWADSHPFDIGITTTKAINQIKMYQKYLKQSVYQQNNNIMLDQMFKNIYKQTNQSMANGSLMRIAPIPYLLTLLNQHPKHHINFIKNQIRLTHSNQVVISAGICWVNMLYQLINRKDDKPSTFKQIFKQLRQSQHASQLKDWFQQAKKSKKQSMNAYQNMGFAKIAFSYGLKILYQLGQEKIMLNEEIYQSNIKWIIGRAGDTDTNAAIAGGLLGALLGFTNLPQHYVARSLKTFTNLDRQKNIKVVDEEDKELIIKQKFFPQRPIYFQPCNVLIKLFELIQKCKHYKIMKQK